MLKNDIKMAIRTIMRNRGYTLINVTGLAIGIASCLLILLFVQHELSYDRFHEKAEQIVRVGLKANIGGNSFNVANSPPPLAEALVNDLPEVIEATRIFQEELHLKYEEELFFEERFYFADPNIFEVFTIPLVTSDTKAALEQPNSIVITPKMADKYFGTDDPLGKVLISEYGTSFQVTGIVAPFPTNSHFQFDFLASSANHPSARATDAWFSNQAYTYIVIEKNAAIGQLEPKLPDFSAKYIAPIVKEGMGVSYEKFLETGNYFTFFLTPLLDIHLHSNVDAELEPTGSYNTVVIFSAIAFIILFVACINYTNLATARASRRANEVGVRKVIGSQKRQLIQQFLVESLFLSTMAFVAALALVLLALPVFNRVVAKQISLTQWENWYLLPLSVGFTVVVGILAGGYPAFLLASFQPATVLKGKFRSSTRERRFRNALVVFQFFTTIVLFAATIIISNQLRYIRNKDLGFNKEHVVVVRNAEKLRTQQQAFKTELERNASIISSTFSVSLFYMDLQGHIFQREGQDTNINYTLIHIPADYNFIDTFQIEMLEGRYFAKENATDNTAVILNEAAVRNLGLEDPIGKQLFQLGNQRIPLTIIGIVKDFHLQSLHEEIRPMVFSFIQKRWGNYLSVRIRPGQIEETLRFIENQWKTFVPGQPADVVFLDVNFDRMYGAEMKSGRVFAAFAGLAIFIAALGLFGLASFTVSQRTKEIGVRKVLGASVPGIVFLLSKEYIKWLFLANILAWPLAFYAMNKWLQNFAFRTSLTVWPFLISGATALVIALLTVSYQSIKAAMSHPVKSLRYE